MVNGEKISGLFLSLEGIDFTWKTPFVEWLKRDLTGNREIVVTRDPPYALSPWTEFKDLFEKGEEVSHLAEAILLLAARIDNNERVILPTLAKGALIIADRYFDSWFAYQAVRLSRYFEGSQEAQRFLFDLNRIVMDNGFLVQPNLTILITDEPERTIERRNKEKKISKYDRLEIQQLVDAQYCRLAEMFPERIVFVDVRNKDINEAYAVIKIIVEKWLERSYKKKSSVSISSDIKTVQVGNRIMALRRLSWTIGKFDDYPLIIESGDLATIISVDYEEGKIIVEWDKDEFKYLPKELNLTSREKFSCMLLS